MTYPGVWKPSGKETITLPAASLTTCQLVSTSPCRSLTSMSEQEPSEPPFRSGAMTQTTAGWIGCDGPPNHVEACVTRKGPADAAPDSKSVWARATATVDRVAMNESRTGYRNKSALHSRWDTTLGFAPNDHPQQSLPQTLLFRIGRNRLNFGWLVHRESYAAIGRPPCRSASRGGKSCPLLYCSLSR